MDWVNRDLLIDAGVNISTGLDHGEDMAVFIIPGGKPAFDLWRKLSNNVEALGGWPLLGGDAKKNKGIQGSLKPDQAERQRILKTVPDEPPLEALIASRRAQHLRTLDYVKQHGPPSLPATMSEFGEPRLPDPCEPNYSKWPEQPPDPGGRLIISGFNYRKEPLTQCLLLIVRTDKPCDVPAYLLFGGFNDCPPTNIHVAFLRNWHFRFGAVPAAMTHDVIELYIPRPVIDRRQAFRIALEQYAYAPDIVDQGTQTVDRLAMEIWGSPCWYFWWD